MNAAVGSIGGILVAGVIYHGAFEAWAWLVSFAALTYYRGDPTLGMVMIVVFMVRGCQGLLRLSAGLHDKRTGRPATLPKA